MLIRRARALFAVSLTFALLQVLAAANGRGARVSSTRAWTLIQEKSHAAEHGPRGKVAETDNLHPAATPFLAPALDTLDVPARVSSPFAASAPAFGTAAHAGRRFARAPPARP